MPDLPEDIEVINSESSYSAETIEAYWTEDVMELAQPIEVPIVDEQSMALAGANEAWTQDGDETVKESEPPDSSIISDHEDIIDIADSFQTTSVGQLNLSNMPYSTVGKMFMTFGNQNYVGTGWVIAENAVFTAGHCVFDIDNGGWADRILFIPQYSNGTAPVGKWSGGTIFSLQGWISNRDYRYDMAVFYTDRPIRPQTGSLGWRANFPPNQGPYKSLGYPAIPIPGYNFNGQYMWQSIGGYIGGVNPIQMHNNMTKGCSGGPWIVTRNRNVYANGLNSFRNPISPGTMYSPYFGNGFLNLYNAI